MKETYRCIFHGDTDTITEPHELEAYDYEDAATDFASYAYSNCDMWEAGDNWTDENSIVVIGPDGTSRRFNILVEYDPVFHIDREIY